MGERSSRRWAWHGVAALVFALADLIICWHGTDFSSRILGGGADPYAFIWFLAWYPHALAQHLDLLYSSEVWAPGGLNLAWVTSVPVLGLPAIPLTRAIGPVLTFDALALAAPWLSALSAYALCLRVAGRPAAAIFGGWLFGFSSFAMSRQGEQLNFTTTCLLPLIVLLVVSRLQRRTRRWPFVAGLAVLLALQAGLSLEIFATFILFGLFAVGLSYAVHPDLRRALAELLGEMALALPLLLLLIAPLLWAMFGAPHDMHLPVLWPVFFATDPLNLVIPTANDALGGAWFSPVSRHFPGLLNEQGSYLGLPLIAMLWLALRRGGLYFGLLLGAIILASCGPELWLGGRETGLPLPWFIAWKLPLLGNALPVRLMLFAFLVSAPVTARWLAAGGPGRWLLAVLAVAFLWPAPRPTQPIPVSHFFTPAQVHASLGEDAHILVLPMNFHSAAPLWQAQSGFAFTQAAAYMGFPLQRLQTNGPMMRVFLGQLGAESVPAIAAYAQAQGLDDIVAGPGTPDILLTGLRQLGWPTRAVDDVTIFTVPHG